MNMQKFPARYLAGGMRSWPDDSVGGGMHQQTAVRPGRSAGSGPDVPGSLPQIHLVSPLPDHDWRLPAGDFANTRFSPLSQITRDNVKNLKVISTMSTGIPHGHEGQPLVVGDTMYIVTPFPNNLIALDLTKPGTPKKWEYQPHPDPRAVGIACCDIVNRGASYADGKIIYNTLDDHTVAVDAQTGKEVWKTQVGDPNVGETTTMAPLVVKDKVFVGNQRRRTGRSRQAGCAGSCDGQRGLACLQHRPR